MEDSFRLGCLHGVSAFSSTSVIEERVGVKSPIFDGTSFFGLSNIFGFLWWELYSTGRASEGTVRIQGWSIVSSIVALAWGSTFSNHFTNPSALSCPRVALWRQVYLLLFTYLITFRGSEASKGGVPCSIV